MSGFFFFLLQGRGLSFSRIKIPAVNKATECHKDNPAMELAVTAFRHVCRANIDSNFVLIFFYKNYFNDLDFKSNLKDCFSQLSFI